MTAVTLTGKQKSHLRGLAHSLEPVVQLGRQGLTAAVLREIDGALSAHELIKVKLPKSDEAEPDLLQAMIETELGASCAAHIGRLLVLYRPHPQKPRIVLPSSSTKRPPKKTPSDE